MIAGLFQIAIILSNGQRSGTPIYYHSTHASPSSTPWPTTPCLAPKTTPTTAPKNSWNTSKSQAPS